MKTSLKAIGLSAAPNTLVGRLKDCPIQVEAIAASNGATSVHDVSRLGDADVILVHLAGGEYDDAILDWCGVVHDRPPVLFLDDGFTPQTEYRCSKLSRTDYLPHMEQSLVLGQRIERLVTGSYDRLRSPTVPVLEGYDSREAIAIAATIVRLGLWEWDSIGDIVRHNQIWFEITGVGSSHLSHGFTEFLSLVHPDDRAAVTERLAEAARTGTSYESEHRMVRPDGRVVWVADRGDVVKRAHNGRPLIWVGAIQDISARKAFEQTILEARQAAESAEQDRRDFIAMLSHEIRTPLAGVIGMLQMAESEPQGSSKREEYFAYAGKSGGLLLQVVQDILDYSKLEARELKLVERPTDLRALVEDVAVIGRIQAETKGIKFEVTGDREALWVDIDSVRLRQVLLNLVSNAIKFTDAGRVVLSLDWQSCSDDAIDIQLEAVDTGRGIRPEDQVKLFRRFSQVGVPLDRKGSHGAGLGLAICKDIVDLMGGEIGCNSILGAGSRFWLRLRRPLGKSPEARLPGPSQKDSRVRRGALRILVAEDDETNQRLAQAMIGRLGHQPTLVSDGRAALATLATAPFDLVLMDIHMPVMDGFEATRDIRDSIQLRDLPVVALTADPRLLDEHPERDLFNGVLGKPYGLAEIADLIDRVVEDVNCFSDGQGI